MLKNVNRFVPRMALVTLALLCVASASAQEPQDPTSAASRADNYYAAGNRIDLAAPMEGDVVVAGRTVAIAQPVSGDILAAGWHVTLSAPAKDDVRIAAGDVVIDAPVSGDLTLAGGDITTGTQAHVFGRSWITGNSVRVNGVFDRELQIAGGTVQIGGEVRQPLRIVAEKLEILPTARILGPVTYKGSTEATVGAGATLSSPIAFERIARREARNARAWVATSTLLFAAHLLLAGLIALFWLPQFESSVVGVLRAQPGKSLLAGFTLLVTVPAAATMLVFSVFGLPLGLALAMCYLMALFLGVLAAAFFVGDLEARVFKAGPLSTRGQHALLLVAGVLTLAVLRLLLGGVVVFVSVLFGLGAVALWIYQAYSGRATSAVA